MRWRANPALRFRVRGCGTAILLVAAVEALPAQGGGILMVERFDTVVPPALPAGWLSSRNRNALQNDFVSTASGAQSPPNALLSTNATVSQELVSPAVSFRDRIPGTLSFSLRRSSTHCSDLVIEASTNQGADFGVCIGDTIRASGETAYRTAVFPLPDLLRGLSGVSFRWRTIAGSSGTSGTMRIDDVVITADVAHDVAVAGFRYDQAAARESCTVAASVLIAGVGRERSEDVVIALGVDRDGNGVLSGGEIWSRTAVSVAPAPSETTEVIVEFVAPAAGEYRLVIFAESPSDQSMENNTLVVSFLAGYRLHAAVVNEIMYAPAGDEPEWIEIFNTGPSGIALASWRIGDGVSPWGKPIGTTSAYLPPGGIVVVARATSPGAMRPGCGAGAIGMEGFPFLNNSGDIVVLRDGAGCLIDSVPYLPGWGGTSGLSLERRDELGASDRGANWGSCADIAGATPCSANSIAVLDTDLALTACGGGPITAGEPVVLRATVRNVGRVTLRDGVLEVVEVQEDGPEGRGEVPVAQAAIAFPLACGDTADTKLLWRKPAGGRRRLLFRLDVPGDARSANDTLGMVFLVGYRDPAVRITEIMAVPRQGDAEYVEVYNAGCETVDIAGWTIGGGDREGILAKRFVFSGQSLGLVPGASFVLASDSSLFRRFAVCDSHLAVVAGSGSLLLNNDADAVVLRDGAGRSVDSVAYTSRWHSPALADVVGRSLERISASLPSSDRRNWGTCVAAAGGTPGCPNSIRGGEPAGVSHVVAAPNPFSPDGDGHDDRTMIHFESPSPSGWMSVRIYDVRGRLVRFLANNEPCGARGTVVWDGFDDRRMGVRIGIYIILFEVAGEDRETVLSAKGSVVVAGRLR